MEVKQKRWSEGAWDGGVTPGTDDAAADLVLVFGSKKSFDTPGLLDQLKQAYPNAQIAGCTTSGEVYSTEVRDDTLTVTSVKFQHTKIETAMIKLEEGTDSEYIGKKLISKLPKDDLAHVIVLAEGLHVNGSKLVDGILSILPGDQVTVTGGLAGDGDRFNETDVFLNDTPEPDKVVAIGFYGKNLKVGYGSLGGWDCYGPQRKITKAVDNVLYELDGQPALDLYKNYLGDQAAKLPSSGLLFPLGIRQDKDNDPLVRTVLGINEEQKSLTFAGQMPEEWYAQFMKANFDRLIDGAEEAATISHEGISEVEPQLALIVSCVGRRLVLKQRVEEELEVVRDTLGDNTKITGFYSYGEISPFKKDVKCELHNQTMTITALTEQ